ncbi:MAG: hypothetical protein AAF804_03610, partial [Bacteroidota bacterium]
YCLSGCEGFFGTRTSIDFLDEPTFDERQVAYVPIQPVWDGIGYPIDVIAGYDELIYVADSVSSEIISFDQAGNETGRFFVPGLQAIAQDRQLNLYATGTKDTTIDGVDFTLAALYRVDLNRGGAYGLNQARIDTAIVHPFYFRISSPVLSDQDVRFLGLATRGNGDLFMVRSGPSNIPNQFGGPDDAVLSVTNQNGQLQSPRPLRISTELGVFSDYFQAPRAITTRSQAPQTPGSRSDNGFYFTSASPSVALGVQSILRIEDVGGVTYRQEQLASPDTSKADGILYEAQRFSSPADITIAGDETGYVFVVDAAKDSLYQFNGQGFEGVEAPQGSRSDKFIKVSFGGTGQDLTQFNQPRGVAYLNRLLYVADAGNGRILRFQLTTDFD